MLFSILYYPNLSVQFIAKGGKMQNALIAKAVFGTFPIPLMIIDE